MLKTLTTFLEDNGDNSQDNLGLFLILKRNCGTDEPHTDEHGSAHASEVQDSGSILGRGIEHSCQNPQSPSDLVASRSQIASSSMVWNRSNHRPFLSIRLHSICHCP